MINNVTLMGRLTAKPELKATPSGKSVISFSIAIDRSYQPKGEEKKADFIPCVAWENTAEFISKWFEKGDMIAVTGEIQTRNYEDKNGNKRVAVEVKIAQASFCGSKRTESAAPATPAATDYNAGIEPVNADDLPF